MDYSHYMYLRREVEEEARRNRTEDTRYMIEDTRNRTEDTRYRKKGNSYRTEDKERWKTVVLVGEVQSKLPVVDWCCGGR